MSIDLDELTMRRVNRVAAEWDLPPEAVIRAAVRAGVSVYNPRPTGHSRP